MKMKLECTIPVAQYGNIRPTWEIETVDEYDVANNAMRDLWAEYTGQTIGRADKDCILMSSYFSKIPVRFYEKSHRYETNDGKPMLSGSTFAHKYTPPFDSKKIAEAYAKKRGIDVQDVLDFWEMKAKISTDFGTAIHAGIEMAERYKSIDEEKCIHAHPIIRSAVLDFIDATGEQQARNEVFVAHGLMCGCIDRLVKTEEGYIIQDMKTNAELKGKSGKLLAPFDQVDNTSLNQYALQLNFYREILERCEIPVAGMEVWHYAGQWTKHNIQNIDITGALQ